MAVVSNRPASPRWDISSFEFFFIVAEHKLVDHLLSYVSPDELARLRILSSRTYWSMESYSRRVWDVDQFFSHWFDFHLLPAVFEKLDECNAVVSGSSALSFFARKDPYPGSDLDIFMPMASLLTFGTWLRQSAGYVYKPRRHGRYSHFDHAVLSIPLRLDHLRGDTSQGNPMSFGSKFEVFDFYKPTGANTPTEAAGCPHVQLIGVLGDPFQHVLSFHSSESLRAIACNVSDNILSGCDECHHWSIRRRTLPILHVCKRRCMGLQSSRNLQPLLDGLEREVRGSRLPDRGRSLCRSPRSVR